MEICNLDLAHFIEFVPGKSDNDFEINIVELKRNPQWFQESLPKLKGFWDSVVKYRSIGIEHHPKFEKWSKTQTTMKNNKEFRNSGITLDLISGDCDDSNENNNLNNSLNLFKEEYFFWSEMISGCIIRSATSLYLCFIASNFGINDLDIVKILWVQR
jgi:hypothetical protein